MPARTILSHKLKKRAQREFFLMLIAVIGFTFLTLAFDIELFELIYELTREYEDWDLDEILLFVVYLSIGGTLYGSKRLMDIKRLNTKVSELAFYDNVTNLPNRALAMDKLSQLVKHSKKKGKKFALVFVDFDNFKAINDTYGHDQGDILLKQVGSRLKQLVKSTDTVARLSGDEFLLLIEFNEEDELELLTNKLTQAQQQPYVLDLNQLKVTFSIGIALYPKNGNKAHDLLKAADTAMYNTKKIGKGEISYYNEKMGVELTKRYIIESGLNSAIDKQEFHIHYQPQVCVKTDNVIGYEALLRWCKNDKYIPPLDFINIAEETGQITQIGLWVLEQAITEIKPELTAEQRISVNVSPRQFHQENLIESIVNLLNKHNFSAEQLELEITESTVANNFEATLVKIEKLKQLGIVISIDDFGTGYSSLIRLRDLNADRVKIDKCFISKLESSDKDVQLLKAIMLLSQNLDLDVIAEGVETEAQVAKLSQLGCNAIQGYYYGQPIPIEQLRITKYKSA